MANFKKFTEAPIDTFQTLGSFEKGTAFRHKPDRAILTSDKAIQKIRNKWANSKHTYDMYFLNTKEAKKHQEVGMVEPEFLEKELNLKDFKINPEAITIIFTGNAAGDKELMSAWILAHRFGHAIAASGRFRENEISAKATEAWRKLNGLVAENINPIFIDGYEYPLNLATTGQLAGFPKSNYSYSDADRQKDRNREAILTSFYEKIGTMKSARDGNLRSPFEFYYELLSQYIFANKISFNPIPKEIPYGKAAWGKQNAVYFRGTPNDMDYYNGYLDNIKDEYPAYADYLLNRCVGKIFVM